MGAWLWASGKEVRPREVESELVAMKMASAARRHDCPRGSPTERRAQACPAKPTHEKADGPS